MKSFPTSTVTGTKPEEIDTFTIRSEQVSHTLAELDAALGRWHPAPPHRYSATFSM